MFIETWIAALIVLLLFAIGIIALLGWMLANQRTAEERSYNKELEEKYSKLLSEYTRVRTVAKFKEFQKEVVESNV